MTRTQAKRAADQVAENARRVAEMNEQEEPTPAPDLSRAVPTTKAARVAFAALSTEDKAVARANAASYLALGHKKVDAWQAALLAPPPSSSEYEHLPSTAGQRTESPADAVALPDRDALYRRAAGRKKEGPRGRASRVLTDDELVAYVAEVRAAYPEARRYQEQEVAYWLEDIALSARRWTRAWDAASERLAS